MSEQLTPFDEQSLMETIGAEQLEAIKCDDVVTANAVSFPLSDVSQLGKAFSGLSTVFSKLSRASNNSGELYRATFPVSGEMMKAKDGSGYYGAIVNEKKTIVGQAKFEKVTDVSQKSAGLSNVYMGLALMAINRSLQNVAETQRAIISFLETDKQTQLKGDLTVLAEILNEYRYNWDNPQWLSNRETQVLNIKRSAEQNILFYKEMIEKKLGGKKQFVRLDAAKSLNEIHSRFKYYKLALYLFSFSSFLDVMLLKNFDAEYLGTVRGRVEALSAEYSDFYSRSISDVESIATTSVQSRTLQGASIAGKFLGKQISRIPDKNNKIKLGDKLLAGSDKLDGINEKSLNETRDSFSSVQDSGIALFVDRIALVEKLYNERLQLYVGADRLYLTSD